MNSLIENIYLLGSVFGLLSSSFLMLQIVKGNKANFFMGLVVFIMAIELLFSWAVRSGYVNSPDAIPFWKLLNYLVIPPGIWVFVQFHTDDNFVVKTKHYGLFIPVMIAYIVEFTFHFFEKSILFPTLWIWFTDYLPMIATSFVLMDFWIRFLKFQSANGKQRIKESRANQVRLLLLMISLTLICACWIVLSFTGGQYFEYVEFILLFLFFGFTLLNFFENQNFAPLSIQEKTKKFPNFNDEKSLKLILELLEIEQPYLHPNFRIQELAIRTSLPARYVSYLINHYHQKNYKEFINQYRIDYFLKKAASEEITSKTLLGLALESGFSSKSTFNLVFKNTLGMSPSEYLKSRENNS